jgi:hypothetical protein
MGVVSFTSRPLYRQGKSPWYPLDMKLGEPQSRSGRSGEEKNSQPLSVLQPPFIQLAVQCYTTEPSGSYVVSVRISFRLFNSNPSIFATTRLLNPQCPIFLEKLTVTQLVTKLPAFHATRNGVYWIRRWPLSWNRRIKPHRPFFNIHSKIILPSMPRSSECFSLRVYWPTFLYTFLTSCMRACYMTRPPHPPWFHHPNNKDLYNQNTPERVKWRRFQ